MKFNKWTLGLAAVGAVSLQSAVQAHDALLANVVKAHEATGHVSLQEHASKMQAAVHKAIQTDARFSTPKESKQGEVSPCCYKLGPYCLDITTPDDEGRHFAIIRTADDRLVRHPFEYSLEDGTVKLADGESKPSEITRVYAAEIERVENIVKAKENIISCRASNGTAIAPSEPWVEGKDVSFIYAPAGVTVISAGFRKNESITAAVEVDEDTAKDLQASFDHITATDKQEPYADEDHEGRKATLRFPAGTKFVFGEHRGEQGIIVQGAQPTSYGAEVVNGKVYASWSPEFAMDADYANAKCKKGHWTFPDGVRGSESNPARMIAVNFVTGALTNKPAFDNMPKVKAKKVEPPVESADELPTADIADLENIVKCAGTTESVTKAWKTRHQLHPTQSLYAVAKATHDITVEHTNKEKSMLPPYPHEGTHEEKLAHAGQEIAVENKHGYWDAKDNLRKAEDAMIDASQEHMKRQPVYQKIDDETKKGIDSAVEKGKKSYTHRPKLVDIAFRLDHNSGVQPGKVAATAATPPADAEIVQADTHADPMAEALDVIYARQFGDKQLLDQILARTPEITTRRAADVSLTRSATGELVVKAKETTATDLDTILARKEIVQDAILLQEIFSRVGADA